MKTIESLLLKSQSDRSLRFVFPSAVAANFWAARVAEKLDGAVALNRFLAWDDFKAETLSEDHRDRRPCNGAARNIFCASLLEENSRTPFFAELLPVAHADCYLSFVSSLSRTLPSLGGIEGKLRTEAASLPWARDLLLLHDRYAAFLEQYGLFEPAWGEAPFRSGNFRWLLLFPELAEDWDQYERELQQAPSVRIVPLSELEGPLPGTGHEGIEAVVGRELPCRMEFQSAKDELREIMRMVRALLDEAGVPLQEIALSVPDLEDWSERIALEARLFDIPLDLRSGKSLADYPVGRLFQAMSDCVSERWSFRALKDLLLDAAFPWKKRAGLDRLIAFGLKYRCVSGFTEDGEEVDVWEKSFRQLNSQIPGIAELDSLYRELKRYILPVVKAPSFAALRDAFIKFKGTCFDQNSFEEGKGIDALISRSLEELSDLERTEAALAGLTVANPFSLFLSHLRGVPYVYQSERAGLRVYTYRVSAGICPRVHFILNATEASASIKADRAPFLREDYKLSLSLADRDLSADFVRGYRLSGEAVIFSASKAGFSGHSFPHTAITDLPESLRSGELKDPWTEELALSQGGRGSGASPARLQLESRDLHARALGTTRPLDLRRDAIEDEVLRDQLMDRLCKEGSDRRVSPTDLNEFSSCPFFWLLSRGLKISEIEMEIETVDQRDLGTLFHRILESLFNRIQQEDPRFRADRLVRYIEILDEEVDAALVEARSMEGAFQESVYAMLRRRIKAAIEDFLTGAAGKLDACEIFGTEFPLRLGYPDYGLSLSGKADLVLAKNDDTGFILDFKTGKMPTSGATICDAEGRLGDYQMAAYLRMLEISRDKPVREASFYSIDNREFRKVVSDEKRRSDNDTLPVSREEFEDTLKALDGGIEEIASALSSGCYPLPPRDGRKGCRTCRYSAVCRSTFAGGEA